MGEEPMSIEAIKTGPTGRTMLLPAEEVAEYEELVASIQQKFWPDTYLEKMLAQAIIDHEWRLRRSSKLREALYTLGRRELAGTSASEAEIDSQVLVRFSKDFKQLAQQERFLQKRLEQDTAELNRLLRDNPKSRRGLFLVPKPRKS